MTQIQFVRKQMLAKLGGDYAALNLQNAAPHELARIRTAFVEALAEWDKLQALTIATASLFELRTVLSGDVLPVAATDPEPTKGRKHYDRS